MKNAIYAGSFDPITNGHIDIINRAKNVFDSLCIGVLHNPEKASLFTLRERTKLIKQVFSDDSKISVEEFSGLLVDFASRKNIFTLIRGLRAVSDFEYEFQMALINRSLAPKLDTIFFMTDSKYSYLSSSIVRQLALHRSKISEFVPNIVETALREKNHE